MSHSLILHSIQAKPLSPEEWERLFNHPTLTYSELAQRLGISYNSLTNYRLGRSLMPYPVRFCLEYLAAEAGEAELTAPDTSFLPAYVGGLYISESDCSIGGYLRHTMGSAGIIRFRDGYLVPLEITSKVLQKLTQKIKQGGFCKVQKILDVNTAVVIQPPYWSATEPEPWPDFDNPYEHAGEDPDDTAEGVETAPLPPYLQAILDSTK